MTRSGPCNAAATTTARCTPRTKAATKVKGQPTVILAKTIKGWTLGSHFEARNSTHQMKKLTVEDLKEFSRPAAHSHRGSQLDEYLPRTTTRSGQSSRSSTCSTDADPRWFPAESTNRPHVRCLNPGLHVRGVQRGSGKQPVATTMAFVRLLEGPDPRRRHRAHASSRSSPTRRAPSAWTRCSPH